MNWYKKAQQVNVLGEPMDLISSESIDGISYELFYGDISGAIRVFDTEAEEIVNLIRYPNQEKALHIYNETLQRARY